MCAMVDEVKPLLSAPLTDEDIDIWVTVMHGVGAPLAEVEPLLRPFFAADRRDADLMLKRESFRQRCADLKVSQMPAWIWWGVWIDGITLCI